MKTNIFQWQYSPVLMLLTLWLPAGNVQAAIDCTASMNAGDVNLGDITPGNADNASISATLNYKCKNTYANSRRVYVCLAADGGSYAPGTILPRYMSTGSSTNLLVFTMKLSNGTLWSTRGNLSGGSEYKSILHDIPGGGDISINVPITISLLAGNANALATPGTYTNNFNSGHTALTTDVSPLGGDGSQLDCTKGTQGNIRFPFEVKATVIKDCKINTTADVNLGSKSATTTNITGNTKIGVTCTNTIPYSISLTPSNNSTTGAGVLTGGGSSVPYNLRKADGGAVWGNVAANWITGIGNAATQTKTVYVDVPSANFIPGSYSDTVTINVNY